MPLLQLQLVRASYRDRVLAKKCELCAVLIAANKLLHVDSVPRVWVVSKGHTESILPFVSSNPWRQQFSVFSRTP